MTSESNPSQQNAPLPKQFLNDLFSVAYEELRRLAASIRRGDPSATLSPTALVNEAWLKLAASSSLGGVSPLQFKQIAAHAMRELLVEAARRRNALKRGGPNRWLFVAFDESAGYVASCEEEMLALHEALDRLADLNPRHAQMVESRFFGGLEVAEVADLLGVSEATILRDWRAARAWLSQELRRSR